MGREAKEGEMILRKLFKHNMKEKKNNKNGMGGKEEGKLLKKIWKTLEKCIFDDFNLIIYRKIDERKIKYGKEYA